MIAERDQIAGLRRRLFGRLGHGIGIGQTLPGAIPTAEFFDLDIGETGQPQIGACGLQITENRRQVRYVRSARSYASASDPSVFFGLSGLGVVKGLEVSWPSGLIEFFGEIQVGSKTTIIEGSGRTPSS